MQFILYIIQFPCRHVPTQYYSITVCSQYYTCHITTLIAASNKSGGDRRSCMEHFHIRKIISVHVWHARIRLTVAEEQSWEHLHEVSICLIISWPCMHAKYICKQNLAETAGMLFLSLPHLWNCWTMAWNVFSQIIAIFSFITQCRTAIVGDQVTAFLIECINCSAAIISLWINIR